MSRPGRPSTGGSRPSIPVPVPFQGVSFLFRIDPLDLDPATQVPGLDMPRRWSPPDQWNAYDRQFGTLFRWKAGQVRQVLRGDAAFDSELSSSSASHFRTATVFTQSPWTNHFLAVDFDAQRQNVSERGGWQDLGFWHETCSNGAVYSHLDITTDARHLAAPGNSAWINELFTDTYRYHAPSGAIPPPVMIGLTGKLPLLLALVAFSCKEADLDNVLTQSLSAGSWLGLPPNLTPHEGRIQFRGMVVSVFLDRAGNELSHDPATLRHIEHGYYGPFFRT